jgi:hypothetical protein
MTDKHRPWNATNLLTLAIKVAGLLIALNEALFEPVRDPTVFATAAFMMAGAQGADAAIDYVRAKK